MHILYPLHLNLSFSPLLSRDFKGTADIVYTCKWFSPLDKVHLVEPDLFSDIWDLLVHNGNGLVLVNPHLLLPVLV